MSTNAIGWRRSRFTRTILGMRVLAATVARLLACCLAARRQWALSIRTDSAALAEADLAIVDSAGTLVGRVRTGSPAAAQARQMADVVLP